MDHIRNARPSDAAALLAIYQPLVRETAISFEYEPPAEAEFAARIERITARDPWLIFERGGEIAGYACASDFRSRPAYATTRETTVYVHPDHHRTGVARELMAALLEDITTLGAHLAVAVIALPNEASVRLHEDLGFTHIGTFREVAWKFERWHDEGLWARRLDQG